MRFQQIIFASSSVGDNEVLTNFFYGLDFQWYHSDYNFVHNIHHLRIFLQTKQIRALSLRDENWILRAHKN